MIPGDGGCERLSELIAHVPHLDEPTRVGAGAALVLPILDAALALLDEMSTFEEAGVATAASGPRGAEIH